MNRRVLKLIGYSSAALLLVCAAVRISAALLPVHLAEQASFDARYFTDRYGKPLGVILSEDQEHTIHVELGDVSPYFVQALVSAEDSRFYEHGGVDYTALSRALWQHTTLDDTRSGASTITMQLARMLDPKPRTLLSKLHEIYQAWRMEAGMSKAEILRAYINRLPMGGNLYGVEAASRHYFGVSARGLDLAQATLLAAIPNNPNHLQPHKNFASLRTRQNYILARLQAQKAIDAATRQQSWQGKLSLRDPAQKLFAPHLLMRLHQTQAHDAHLLQTTLDLELQRFIEQQVRHTLLYLNGVRQAAVLVVNNRNGEVLAYVGSPDYYEPHEGMNDGVQAKRQSGSALKPFLYEYSFEKNLIQPTTILADIPSRWDLGDQPGQYAPQDYSKDFLGPVRASAALANSLNVPAVRLLETISVPAFQARLQTLGIHLANNADYYGLGLVLGGAEVSLEDMTRAYLTFARSGDSLPLQFVRAVNGKRVANENELSPVGDAQTWQLTGQLLSDPYLRAQSFGVDSILRLPFPVAVKTGTSSHHRDNWTFGFSSDYTVGVWVGNFDGEPMNTLSGVTGAAPLFAKIMLRLHENSPPTALPLPEKFVKVRICPLSGEAPGKFCPHVALDFIAKDRLAEFEAHPCDWHQPHNEVRLPALYQEWAQRHQVQVAQSGVLRILHPVAGSRYVLSNTIPTLQQNLELRVSGIHEGLVWQVDGHIMPASEDHLLWPVQLGKHTLHVNSVDGQQAEAMFEVVKEEDLPVANPADRPSQALYPLALH